MFVAIAFANPNVPAYPAPSPSAPFPSAPFPSAPFPSAVSAPFPTLFALVPKFVAVLVASFLILLGSGPTCGFKSSASTVLIIAFCSSLSASDCAVFIDGDLNVCLAVAFAAAASASACACACPFAGCNDNIFRDGFAFAAAA